MFYFRNTQNTPASGGGGGSGTDGSMADILSSAVFDIDVTQTGGFDGTQTLANLVTSPSDGSTQTDYDFQLGQTISASTDDPTITNEGTQTGQIAFDGGDVCTTKAASSPTFLKNMLKTGSSKKYTIALCFQRDPSALSYALGFGNIGSSAIGFGLWTTATGSVTYAEHTGSFSSRVLPGANIPATPSILILSYDVDTTTLRYWDNSRTKKTTTIAHDTNSSDLENTHLIGAINFGGSYFYASDDQITYALSVFDQYIDDTEAEDIIDEYNTRHGRTYA